MTRPSFTTMIPRPVKYVGNSDSWDVMSPDALMTSEVVSGVSRRKPKGWVPPTGYNLLRIELQRALGTCETGVIATNWSKYSGVVGEGRGRGRFDSEEHFNRVLTVPTAREPLSTSAALVAARRKLKDSRVNLGVAFAERKATTRMLADTTNRMVLSVRELRRGHFRNAARALGIIHDPGRPRGSNWTNHWLQLQYGWKPLLSDIYGACDALSKRPSGDWRVTVKASRRDSDEWLREWPPVGSTRPTANFDACRIAVRRDRGVFVRIDAIPSNDLTMSLTSLGVTNPLLVAWELVPYSFVVDWLLPVGNWLDSLDALLGYSQAWTSTTTRNEVWWEDVGLSKTWSTVGYIRNNYVGTKRLLEIKRTASSGVPLPAFPRFKDPVSLGHAANGLSLLAQAFGRK